MFNLEHPQITAALLWGYPNAAAKPLLCADCGEDTGDYAYEVENGIFVCEECFKDRMTDFVRLNPRQAADAMDISWKYLA